MQTGFQNVPGTTKGTVSLEQKELKGYVCGGERGVRRRGQIGKISLVVNFL